MVPFYVRGTLYVVFKKRKTMYKIYLIDADVGGR